MSQKWIHKWHTKIIVRVSLQAKFFPIRISQQIITKKQLLSYMRLSTTDFNTTAVNCCVCCVKEGIKKWEKNLIQDSNLWCCTSTSNTIRNTHDLVLALALYHCCFLPLHSTRTKWWYLLKKECSLVYKSSTISNRLLMCSLSKLVILGLLHGFNHDSRIDNLNSTLLHYYCNTNNYPPSID